MRALSSPLRKQLETAVLAARRAAESASRAALDGLGVFQREKPGHLDAAQAALRNGLRAKSRQLGDDRELLVAECAYEQWHRLLFARFLAENNLLLHPKFRAPVTLEECADYAAELGEPDEWSVAARFAAEILPGIFRLDDPCVRLRLAPEGRYDLEQFLGDLPAEVFAADDALGWVYQFWQKDKKDEVNVSQRKIGGADLGPVTQLFTENYMVRFLLENSLGAWWAARHPGSPLVKGFEYLRLGEDGNPAAGSFGGWPDRVAEVTVMDPCCGSGHFLVEALSMLWQMRAEEEGLSPVDAQDAVLRDNLFGLELDPRCVQIAMFAVALQAWKAGGRWRPLPVPHIACSGMPVKAPVDEWRMLGSGEERLESALVRLHVLFRDADTLGSLIDPRRATEMRDLTGLQRSFDDAKWDEVRPLLQRLAGRETADPAKAVFGSDAVCLVQAASYLSRAYTLIVTNVPFLGVGKMTPQLEAWCKMRSPTGIRNLGTVFFDVFAHSVGSTVAMVLPADFLGLAWFRNFRERVLRSGSIHAVARLGPRAFSTSMFDYLTCLFAYSVGACEADHAFFEIDLDKLQAPEIPDALRTRAITWVAQRAQLSNPDARVEKASSSPEGSRLSTYAQVFAGAKPGQTARVTRFFWELPNVSEQWQRLSSSPDGVASYSGKSQIVMTPAAMRATGVTGFDTVGGGARGRRGVLIAKMGRLNSCHYDGSWSDDNTYSIIPRREADLPAIVQFVRSPEFHESVRRVSAKTAVPVGAVSSARVNLDDWRQAAKEAGPLPEPWSDDPTQWLFEGRPEGSTAPLQVSVGRLIGQRWPEQAKDDGLDAFADSDGIVCLPSVAGEAPAADRVQRVLAAAFGRAWPSAGVKKLLEQAGSKTMNLADWLRDEFFKQHCSLFGNRPFVWHISDGQRVGFSALVNYHRLDRKLLEKLTYTYLGQDWVERQRAGVRDEVAGAESRLSAALELQRKLEAILDGDKPYDIYVRWKNTHEQPMGWEPDLNDGVRLNIRPFVQAGVLKSFSPWPFQDGMWKKDRGKNPDGSERHNDLHLTLAEKRDARERAGRR